MGGSGAIGGGGGICAGSVIGFGGGGFGLGGADGGAGDDAGAAAEGEVFEAPLDEDLDAALKLDDVHEVDEEPGHPRDQAGDVNAENIGDGGGATDDGHVTFIEIVEWARRWFSFEARENHFGGVMPFLNGGLRDAGNLFAILFDDVSKIADDENVWKIGNGEIGKDFDLAVLVGFGGSAFGETLAEGSDVDAAGPENGFGVETAGGIALLEVEAVGVDVGDESIFADVDAETGDELFGFGGKIFGIRGENARAAFEKNDVSFFGTNAAKIVAQGFASDFGEGAGEFEPGGAGTDNDEGEPGAGFGFGGGTLGAFEGVEKFVADGGGFFDGFEAGSIFAPLVFAVVGGFGAGGDDEEVVGEDTAVAKGYVFRDRIDIGGFTEKNFGIFLAAQNSAKRRGNLAGRKRAGGDLIEEGLEEMEVATVEEGDLRRRRALAFVRQKGRQSHRRG